MSVPDPYAKTITVPIVIHGGRIVALGGDELPEISEGTVGDLIVPAYAIKDAAVRGRYLAERVVELLPVDTVVMVGVSYAMIGKEAGPFKEQLARPEGLIDETGWRFVDVKLLAPLNLRVRGQKSPQLVDCPCHIPMLNRNAISLNHRVHYDFNGHRNRAAVAQRQRVQTRLRQVGQALVLARPPSSHRPGHHRAPQRRLV